MYRVAIQFKRNTYIQTADYNVKGKDLKIVLDFCEKKGYEVVGIKPVKK